MKTTDLNAAMRNILARMACLSYGTTQSWNTGGGGGGSNDERDPRPPGGSTFPLHEHWAGEYNDATTDAARARVLKDATVALDRELCQIPTSRPDGETREQEEQRQAKRVLELHADGAWTTNDMAMDTGLTIGQVKAIIAAVALAAPAAARDEARAVEMYRSGDFTLRQIERTTNVPKDTVRRLGRRAA
jgi:hypothetical protein